MVRAPQVVHQTLPPVYATHHRTVMVRPPTAGWQPIGAYGGGYGWNGSEYSAGYGAG
jgi:hypothetical protein